MRSLVYVLPLPLALACGEPLSAGDQARADASISAETRATEVPSDEPGSGDPIWTPLAALEEARSHHAAARITAFSVPGPAAPAEGHGSPLAHEGRVLVAGGYGDDGEPLATSEIFNPATGAWEAGAELRTPRGEAASAAYFNAGVEDFRLFVAGGEGAEGLPLSSVERYSAKSETFQLYAELDTPRVGHTLDLIAIPGIPLAEILLSAGGSDGVEILDTSEVLLAGEPADVPSTMNEARRDHASAPFAYRMAADDASDELAGAVVVTGGEGRDGLLTSAEIFDVVMMAGGELDIQEGAGWGDFGSLNEPRKHHTMTSVDHGLLVAGGLGEDGEPLASAELFGERWFFTDEMNVARAHHTATRLFDGRVLVVGGTSDGAAHPEVWDPQTDEWTLLDDLPCTGEARHAHSATLFADGSLLVVGGEGVGGERLATAERYSLDGGILARGDACNRDCQCESGSCVDGVCCDRACEGSCEACHLPGSEGTCTIFEAGFQGNPTCDGHLVCDGTAGICPESCSVDADCAGAMVCESGRCVSPQECLVDEDCAEGEICDDGSCSSGAAAEGLLGWSCATAGGAGGGAAGASILALGILLAATRRRKTAGAAGIGLGALLLVFALPSPATAETEAGADADAYAAQGEVGQSAIDMSSSGPGYDPASRLRLGVGAFGDGVAGHVGAEVGVGFQALRWLDVGVAATLGERMGGRLTATIDPFDFGIINPFIQARGGVHATDDSVSPAAGTWLGASIEAGPGRFRAGLLGEYFGNPDDFHAWAAGAMVGYELGSASRLPRSEPAPIVRDRVVEVEVEVEAEPPPPTQAIRGVVLDGQGARVDDARVELWAAGGDQPIDVWDPAGQFERELEAGSYELRIQAPDYRSRIDPLDLREGETIVVYPGLVAEPEEPAVAELTEERIEVRQRIRFELDSARLHSESHATLDQVARVLHENPEVRIRVEGHTDSTGASEYNLDLSKQRAAAVVDYLVAAGIDEERLQSEGFGDTQPVADNATEEGRAQNRRVQFEVVAE